MACDLFQDHLVALEKVAILNVYQMFLKSFCRFYHFFT